MVITAWYAVNWSVSRKWAWPAWPRLSVIEGDKVWVLMGIGNKAMGYDATDVNRLQLIGNDLWLTVMRRRAELDLVETKTPRHRR